MGRTREISPIDRQQQRAQDSPLVPAVLKSGSYLHPAARVISPVKEDKSWTSVGNTRSPTVNDKSTGYQASSEDLSAQPDSEIFATAPGRLQNIRPLHPNRAKSAKSKLQSHVSSSSGHVELQPPNGCINSGLDCYATSLLQVLLRQSSCVSVLESTFHKKRTSRDSIVRLLVDFHQSFSGSVPASFPQLRQTLYGVSFLVHESGENTE